MYALTGQIDGATIVEVTDPRNPEPLVFIPSEVPPDNVYRDLKVYENYVYIVSDDKYTNVHGMQVIDLRSSISAAREHRKRYPGELYMAQTKNIFLGITRSCKSS